MANLNEDGFFSKSGGRGFVGMSYAELWEAVAEDRIPGDVVFAPTMMEAKGVAIMEFDKSKLLSESVSLQPALVAIHTSRSGLGSFISEREIDAMFIAEGREQTEMMIWFFKTSPMVKTR